MATAPDQDLREYQREMALAGLDRRNTSKGSSVGIAKSINRKTRGNLRFELDEDEELLRPPRLDESDEEDELLAYAVQESMESESAKVKSPSTFRDKTPPDPPDALTPRKEGTPEDDFYTDYPPPSRLEWALAFANSGPSRSHSTPSKTPTSSLFGKPSLLASPTETPTSLSKLAEVFDPYDDMEEVNLALPKEPTPQPNPGSPPLTTSQVEQSNLKSPSSFTDPSPTISLVPSAMLLRSSEKPRAVAEPPQVFFDSDEEMEEVPMNPLPTDNPLVQIDPQTASSKFSPRPRLDLGMLETGQLETGHSTLMISPTTPPLENQGEGETEERLFAWSRTPSPSLEIDEGHPSPPGEEWDAADEIDVQAEEGEFARFMSQMKGKNLDDVRNEIDDEIKSLNQKRKAAIRDSEDITQQMIAQIMVATTFSLSRNSLIYPNLR
jgi:DNA excision repair protein ERCC-5